MELGTVVFQFSNGLLAAGWLTLAWQLWRVRKHNILKGGEYPVIATLLVYALTRVMTALDHRPWEYPELLALMSGLSLTSVWILVRTLNELAKQPPPKGQTLVLNGDLAKVYHTIKRGEGKDQC